MKRVLRWASILTWSSCLLTLGCSPDRRIESLVKDGQEPQADTPSLQGTTDQAAAARLAAMERRLESLESVLQQQIETSQREQELVVGALEATVDRLDGFLRRVQRAEPEAAVAPPEETKSASQQAAPAQTEWWWVVVGFATAIAVVWVITRPRGPRSRGAAAMSAGPTTPIGPEETGALVDRGQRSYTIEHPRPMALVGIAERWLAEDPRILVQPPPEVDAGEDRLRLRYHLAPDLPVGEATRVETELGEALGGQELWGSGPDGDSNVLTGQTFKDGNDEGAGYTPRPRSARFHQTRP